VRAGIRQREDRVTPDVCSQPRGSCFVDLDEDLFDRVANSGGPMSRGRRERISATLLGNDEGDVRCPRVLRVGLDFGRRSPLAYVRELLKACGFSDEQEARLALALPQEPCICRPNPAPSPTPVRSLPASEALYQALVLGLCTAWCYDPRRPVLWTRASLTRQLELFDGRGFYA
jgi:hypothetical protein